MNYYVVRVKLLLDGTTKKSELMEYDTRQEAVAKFHSNLGTDMADDTLAGSMCVVLNGHGGTEIKDFWERPVDPDPEENTEE